MNGEPLTLADRETISRELVAGQSCRSIARLLTRNVSVISREVTRNGGRCEYRAVAAHERAGLQARRPKPRRLTVHRRLHDEVNAGLGKEWSPRQISRRLRVEFPEDHTMRVSHETIYQCLYLQAKGQLRTELVLALRQGRARRVPRTRPAVARGTIPNMANVSERPAEAEDRAVPGYWEGDLIIGAGGKSQIATLVERSTRFCILVKINYDRTADRVALRLAKQMEGLPEFLRKSITWDQGKEMAAHQKLTIATGIAVYFCDPHSPWQRGTNENTNGLLRQYFPKGTDLSVHSQADLDAIAARLNDRPRQTLDFLKPIEAFNKLLADASVAPTT